MAKPDRIALNLSQNIIELRNRRDLTQDRLAQLAKLPRSTISHLESGSANPSLKNLASVAAALQVSIEELISTPRKEAVLIPKKDVPEKVRQAGKVKISQWLPDPIPGMLIEQLELKPGTRHRGSPHIQGTKEYLVGLEGHLQLELADTSFEVGPGDVLAFSGDQIHIYNNPNSKKARALSVVAIAPAAHR